MSIKLLIMEAGEKVRAIEAEIGVYVRELRKAKGLTQEVLADRCGIVRRTLFSLESGDGGNLTTLLSVLEELGALEESTSGLRQPTGQKSTQKERRRSRVDREDKRPPVSSSGENPWVMSDRAVL